jgi:protein TonB
MPNAGRMARLEEGYRKKYGPEVAEGETRFLNTDDIQFGSFLRRFESAVYGVWRYPREAAMLGIEGVTPVKITFNRKGEVVKVEILDSSGSRILDDEVLRTLRILGPIGGFPKGYDKDTFNLIAFFQYGIIRGTSRGMLH